MTEDKRYFHFNQIIIIESLNPNERKTGKELYNDIVSRIPYKIQILKTAFHHVGSKEEFLHVFTELDRSTANNDCPFLHFEIHGSKEGFYLHSGALITWTEVTHELRKLNIKTRNNLMVSLATCYGAWIYSSILPSQRAPFWGFIGQWDKILNSDSLVSFTQFFEYVMNCKDIQQIDLLKAVTALNAFNTGSPFSLIVAEEVFNRVLDEHEIGIKRSGALTRRVDEIFKKTVKNNVARNKFSRKGLKREIERFYISRQPTRDSFRNHFLMLDMPNY